MAAAQEGNTKVIGGPVFCVFRNRSRLDQAEHPDRHNLGIRGHEGR
jgi:hypothetical protein